jgi:hypothetical protein
MQKVLQADVQDIGQYNAKASQYRHLPYQSQGITCQMRSMDFFDWQGVGGIHGGAMDDEHNAGRRKKTRSRGMLSLGIGIGICSLH